MKRVLHITGGMQRAGAETLLMNLYRNLDRSAYQFDFLYFTDKECDYDLEIKSLGGKIYRIPVRSSVQIMRVWKRYWDFNKLMKLLPDHQIIHSHINLNGAFFLLIAYYNKKKILVSHSHISKGSNSLFARIYRYITRRIIKKFANVYMACGEAAGTYLYPSISREEIVVFPNSIDISAFQSKSPFSDKLRSELELKPSTKIITQIGRFTFQKNFEFSINFAEYLISRGEDIHFVFLGMGSLESKLKRMVMEKNLEAHVTFYGISSEIPEILHSSDILFMPSNLEGFPVVLVEAQACGLPCLISTNISSEVDMGLNLIQLLDLEAGFEKWHEALKLAYSRKLTNFKEIKRQMQSRNFDAVESVKKLQTIYTVKI